MPCDSGHQKRSLHSLTLGSGRAYDPTRDNDTPWDFLLRCLSESHFLLAGFEANSIRSCGIGSFKLTKRKTKSKYDYDNNSYDYINRAPKVYLSWSPDYLSTINSLFCLILYEFSVTHNWHNAPKINLYKCLLWLLTTAEMVIISNEKNEKRLLGWYLCWSHPANRKQFKSKSLGNSLLVGCFLVYATAFFCKCK